MLQDNNSYSYSDWRLQESCSHIVISDASSEQRCFTKRLCRSWLERPGCQIDEYGRAKMTMHLYSSELDYRHALNRSLVLSDTDLGNDSGASYEQHWRFQSRDAKYCATNDTTCRRCVEAKFWMPSTLSRPDSRFCLGTDGCVCIANWELPDPTLSLSGERQFDCEPQRIITARPTGVPSLPSITDGSSGALLSSILIGAAAVLLLMGLAVCAHIRHTGWQAHPRLPPQRRREPAQPRYQLDLRGWWEHRENAYFKSNDENTEGPVTSSSTNYIQLGLDSRELAMRSE